MLRFCYRARWEEDQQQASQWVDFPKLSDPEADQFFRVPRPLREALPFAAISGRGSVLSLGSRGDLRRLVDSGTAGDFGDALDALLQGIAGLADELGTSADLVAVLERIFQPLRVPLNLAGLPGISVPFGTSGAGLPLSVQFMGRPLSEYLLMDCARQLEAVRT